eukprot:11180228-Lingulodinium_polyedra.AAC.1
MRLRTRLVGELPTLTERLPKRSPGSAPLRPLGSPRPPCPRLTARRKLEGPRAVAPASFRAVLMDLLRMSRVVPRSRPP